MPVTLKAYAGPAFHYTSSGALLGVLQYQSIRASAAASLNDLGEVRQGWKLIRKILKGMPDSPSISMLKMLAKDPLRRPHEVFVLSASMEGDDAAQWRLYGQGGRGYCLELDGSVALAAVSDPARHPLKSKPASTAAGGALGEVPEVRQPAFRSVKDVAIVSPWRRVLYRQAQVREAVAQLVKAADEYIEDIEQSKADEEGTQNAYENLQDEASEVLSTIAHLFKRRGFSGEREVRVVTTFFWGADQIDYRESDSGIVAYITLAAAPSGDSRTVLRPPPGEDRVTTMLPVRSVRLGPLLEPAHTKTLRAFLLALKLRKVKVRVSKVPLR